MPLTSGSRLGSHEIVGLLGAGGMGEVYRARDTKLNRDVAIKVLPEAYAADPERVARFHREAQAVAALNHPRIAAIYELAEADGARFLVLELVDGDTLSDRLRRGAMPIDEALAVSVQILDALEAAHEKGICHRDLKPANIKVTPDGTVKVLDFGLAKFLESGSSTPNLTQSPTLSLQGTIPGVILGTAGYMSPEQAKGYQADQRSDLFSFGCVLYEMLTGRQAFDGESVSEILAGVIKSDVDLARLPPRLTPRLGELLRRCLEKNPKKRWHAAADVRVELESIAKQPLETPAITAGTSARRPLWRRALPWAVGVLVGTAIGAPAAWVLKSAPLSPVIRFEVELAEGQGFTNTGRRVLALSPDGSKLVYVANRRLFVRELGGLSAQAIQGSEDVGAGVVNPVFSPDGRSVLFWSASDEAFKRISITGGTPATVAKTPNPFAMSWDVDDRILFARPGVGILEVAASGGEPAVIIPVDSARVASAAQLLPDRRTVLYSVKPVNEDWSKGEVVAQPIGGAPTTIIGGASDARYLPATGHIVYASSGLLRAVRFDPTRMEARGEAVTLIEGVRRVGIEQGNSQGLAQAVFSSSGVLAFITGPATADIVAGSELARFEASGAITTLKLPRAPYFSPRVSPDATSLAYDIDNEKEANIWVYQLSGTSAPRRLTFGGRNKFATWSSDGLWLLFQSDREGDLAVFRQRADGSGAAERVTRPGAGEAHIPQAMSPDRRHLIVTVQSRAQGAQTGGSYLADLNLVDGKASRIDGTQSIDAYTEGALSPDGRWLAYYARPAAQAARQTFLQPFPATGARYLVLSGTAGHPVWTRDGKNLIVNVSPTESFIVSVTTPAIQFGEPRLFSREGRAEPNPSFARRAVDALPDGSVIGVKSLFRVGDASKIVVAVNWFDELRRKLPAR